MITYTIASTLEEVLQSWGLVYHTYLSEGLINENPFQIHTNPYAISPNTIVVMELQDDKLVGTLSAYGDSEIGLPLDSVYKKELDLMRLQRKRILEIGLYATSQPNNSIKTIAQHVKFPFYFAHYNHYSDLIIGVHPHHARFYTHVFGFKEIGEVKTYPCVQDHLVVLLSIDVDSIFTSPLRGIHYCIETPAVPELFEHRYQFDPKEIEKSPIGKYLAKQPIGLYG
jgi:hypothetical protein